MRNGINPEKESLTKTNMALKLHEKKHISEAEVSRGVMKPIICGQFEHLINCKTST